MKFSGLFSRLMASYILIVLMSLTFTGAGLTYLVRQWVFSAREKELLSRGTGIAQLLEGYIQGTLDASSAARLLDIMDTFLDARLWLFDAEGRVIATSERHMAAQRRFGPTQAQVQAVLAGEISVTKWPALALTAARINVGLPVVVNGRVQGAVFLSATVAGYVDILAAVRRQTVYAALAALVVAVFVAWNMSRAISRPLSQIGRIAEQVANGNFSERVEETGTDEIATLARTFNLAVDEVERTVSEQQRLDSIRREFVANLSHEFRAPLASIRGFLEAMLMDMVSEEERARYLNMMLDDAKRLGRLVDDMLELSRIQAPQARVDLLEVDAVEALERAKTRMSQRAARAGVDIQVAPESDPVQVLADPDRLDQILTNLVENAIKFTKPGGHVRLSVRDAKDRVWFWVSDTGRGIPEQDLPYIWDRFYKVDKARDRADLGTGLGLAIVKELVLLHGGDVAVESEPGRGSRFGFWLKRVAQ
ncbi:MAG: HAMP domain-containing sensor histidine kinase [Bacillota bacterium]